MEVEYGEYPTKAAKAGIQQQLERLYQSKTLQPTTKFYTTDSRKYNDYQNGFLRQEHQEYEYLGKKYIRVIANSCFDNREFTLSNGKNYHDGDAVWIEVEKVKWLVDERYNLAITEKAIFSGVQFNKTRNYQGNFRETDIKKFMDNHLSKELIQDRDKIIQEELKEVNSKKKNPYNFDFNMVSEEEIIKGAIKSNVAVMLHGKSSDGKSSRVKQLDPECEIVYLGTATPESLIGKSVYNSNTGEMLDIPPSWFKKIKAKCEAEPDKIHIVFFDEITNASPAIQKMAFNIILDKEINGIFKLPKNCRIAAAGNEVADSLSANPMSEPLFNRFAHVYIETTLESWLDWASTPEEEYEKLDYHEPVKHPKIHPAIYAYISYRGESVLRTKYTGEKPNADPRKWEMASKVLYQTNNPEMIRALVGEEITRDFCGFCSVQVITLQDVLTKNYNEQDLEMTMSEKYACVVGLSSCNDKQVAIVRDFIIKKLGEEPCALFDTLWTKGNLSRMEKISELSMVSLSEGGIKR